MSSAANEGYAARADAIANDTFAALGFYTRLPTWRLLPPDQPMNFTKVQWAAPLAGIVIGLLLGVLNAAIDALDVPDLARGVIVIGAGLLLTGALHEDGLADVADGFGGGSDRERKLAIMKDSRLGSYGALALVFSFALRAACIASLTEPAHAALALVAAHGSARALMPAMLHDLPNARREGVAHSIGVPSLTVATVALLIGAFALLPLGPISFLLSVVALCATYFTIATLTKRQIGGQTGDVCGALQQSGEMAILVICASVFN